MATDNNVLYIRLKPEIAREAEACAAALGISKTDYGRMAVRLLMRRGLDYGQEQLQEQPAAAAAR